MPLRAHHAKVEIDVVSRWNGAGEISPAEFIRPLRNCKNNVVE